MVSKIDTFAERYENVIKPRVLQRLTAKTSLGTESVPLYDMEDEHGQVFKVLEDTVRFREGRSVLLIGPRGVGKTTLVNNCLLELENKYKGQYLVIRISGMYERDDKTAIREIARQLDFIVGDDDDNGSQPGFERLSANATMHTIMNILDQSRLKEEGDESGSADSRIPLIFLIDEVDKYASNSKQTLLYNLFDIAQASSGRPIDGKQSYNGTTVSVIGVTTKATVREQLEKRVKSRFSQRMIQINKCKTLSDFCGAVESMLELEDEDEYNERIGQLIGEKGGDLRQMIVQNYYTVKDLNALKNSLLPYMAHGFVQSSRYVLDGHLEVYDDGSMQSLATLSELELKLLICAARVKEKNALDRVNFNVAFQEYLRMATNETNTLNTQLETLGVSLRHNGQYSGGAATASGGFAVSRELLLTCWERLAQVGIMGEPMKQINGVSAASYTGGEFNKMYLCDVGLDEIMKYFKAERAEGEFSWVERWCRI